MQPLESLIRLVSAVEVLPKELALQLQSGADLDQAIRDVGKATAQQMSLLLKLVTARHLAEGESKAEGWDMACTYLDDELGKYIERKRNDPPAD